MAIIPRRVFSKCLLGAAAFSTPSLAFQTPTPSLREVAAKKNLLVGSAVSSPQLDRPDFTRVLAQQASIVVCENDMKWQIIHPEPKRFDFTRADALLSFAKQHGQKLRGHNLCWHNQLPGWFAGAATSENATDLLTEHIAEVAGHFRGQIHSWDVVNEAIAVEDGEDDGLRKTPWLELLGPQYIDMAFRAAAKADPKALLTYNDFDLEQDSPKHEAKRVAVLKLLTSLRERDVPIQALGLQAHLHAGGSSSNWTGLNRFLDQVERLGLQVFITELDVEDSDLPADTQARDQGVAQLYAEFLKTVLAHTSVKAVLTWGLSDANTWLNSRHPRKDHLPKRPLPFDPDLKPAPAFTAMRDAIAAAPARS